MISLTAIAQCLAPKRCAPRAWQIRVCIERCRQRGEFEFEEGAEFLRPHAPSSPRGSTTAQTGPRQSCAKARASKQRVLVITAAVASRVFWDNSARGRGTTDGTGASNRRARERGGKWQLTSALSLLPTG